MDALIEKSIAGRKKYSILVGIKKKIDTAMDRVAEEKMQL